MSIICKEHAESRCDSYPHCYGCNAFANPTNFDRIKSEISKMDMEEFIDFCSGALGWNVICHQISDSYRWCGKKRRYTCRECIREYLGRNPD